MVEKEITPIIHSWLMNKGVPVGLGDPYCLPTGLPVDFLVILFIFRMKKRLFCPNPAKYRRPVWDGLYIATQSTVLTSR